MARILTLITLFCLIPAVPQPAAAQTATSTPIPGLEVIAERQYAVNPQATLEPNQNQVMMLIARVMLFDNDEHANATWDAMVDDDTIANDIQPNAADVKMDTGEVDGVGDRAFLVTVEARSGSADSGAYRSIFTQRGNAIVVVTAIAGSMDTATIADDLAKVMIEREPGSGQSTFDGLGRSSGGVWDMFPPADDAVLNGLVAYADKETRPSNAS